VIDHSREATFIVNRAVFEHIEGRYEGHGFLKWSPPDGYSLEVAITKQPAPKGQSYGIGHVGPLRRQDVRTVRMKLHGGLFAVARVPIRDLHSLSLFFHRTLSVRFGSAVFFDRRAHAGSSVNWYGEAVYRLGSKPMLLDSVVKELRIADEPFETTNYFGIIHLTKQPS
jgi:hypothetical protein